MIVDLIRATDEHEGLGLMTNARRLNVLMSRQRQVLVIMEDKSCTKLSSLDSRDIRYIDYRNCVDVNIFS